MLKKVQSTRLNRNLGKLLDRLEVWAVNPWRRFSLLLIALLSAFLIGRSIGVINGVLALMDPIGALITVLIWEGMVRFRDQLYRPDGNSLPRQLLDVSRFGLLYGLLLEGFKLL